MSKVDFDVSRYPEKRRWYHLLALDLFLQFVRKFWHVQASGVENIPRDRNFVMCCNHQSSIDLYYVIGHLNKKQQKEVFTFLKREALDFSFIHRFGHRAVQCVPLDRSGPGCVGSLLRARKLLEEGKILVVFPEGTRTKDGKIHEFLDGAGHLAFTAQKDILPVRIEGAFQAWPHYKNASFYAKREVRVIYLPLISVSEYKVNELMSVARSRIMEGHQ